MTLSLKPQVILGSLHSTLVTQSCPSTSPQQDLTLMWINGSLSLIFRRKQKPIFNSWPQTNSSLSTSQLKEWRSNLNWSWEYLHDTVVPFLIPLLNLQQNTTRSESKLLQLLLKMFTSKIPQLTVPQMKSDPYHRKIINHILWWNPKIMAAIQTIVAAVCQRCKCKVKTRSTLFKPNLFKELSERFPPTLVLARLKVTTTRKSWKWLEMLKWKNKHDWARCTNFKWASKSSKKSAASKAGRLLNNGKLNARSRSHCVNRITFKTKHQPRARKKQWKQTLISGSEYAQHATSPSQSPHLAKTCRVWETWCLPANKTWSTVEMLATPSSERKKEPTLLKERIKVKSTLTRVYECALESKRHLGNRTKKHFIRSHAHSSAINNHSRTESSTQQASC